jgi:hypothetical protein
MRLSYTQFLKAKAALDTHPGEHPMHMSISRNAVEARDAGSVLIKFHHKLLGAGGEFGRREIAGLGRGTLNQVGESNAIIEQSPVMLRPEPFDRKRSPHRDAQDRAGEGRPEPVGRSRKIVSSLNGKDRWIDTDKDNVKLFSE